MTLGYVYKLWSDQGPKIYIGSTTNLKVRFNKHKTDRKCMSRILFEKYSDVKFEILELIEYQFKVDMLNLEKEHIKLNKEFVVNKSSPIRTLDEKKEYNTEKSKLFYLKNKDEAKEKQKQYYLKNEDKIKEYYREYNLRNKDEIKEKKKNIIYKIRMK